jgi:AAA+ ATPase superfamily predicted ATPase
MKFYNREKETELLKYIEQRSLESAEMTFVVGRRRVGKTALLNKFFDDKKALYFFVEKKNETLLCEEFLEEIRQKFGTTVYGQIGSFKQIFTLLMDLSQKEHFTVIIDEFQEFHNINTAIYSEMQNVWDSRKDASKINLILCGSVYSLMTKIFQNSKEPLFGRATARLHLNPFDIQTLKDIYNDHYPNYTNEDLLAFYIFTGGIAKYVELLIKAKAFTKKKILNEFLTANSIFLTEGKTVLIDEFGKDYGNYFSILSLIASSKTERSEIENKLNMPVGGYLDKLEKEYSLIKRVRPFGAKEGSRNNKYKIEDNFLNFWFRFVYKYRSAVEIGNFDYMRDIVERDYETYSGLVLEKYFRQKLIESKQFSEISSYWNRKGEDEIDIIAVNEMEKRLVFYEVKRNGKRISIPLLEKKAEQIVKNFSNYNIEYKGLSLEDM